MVGRTGARIFWAAGLTLALFTAPTLDADPPSSSNAADIEHSQPAGSAPGTPVNPVSDTPTPKRGVDDRARTPPPSISLDVLTGTGDSSTATADARWKGRGIVRSGWAVPVQPGEQADFQLVTPEGERQSGWSRFFDASRPVRLAETVAFDLPSAELSVSSTGLYRLKMPPKPGNYPLRISVSREAVSGNIRMPLPPDQVLELTLLVMAPFDRSGNGLVGDYPVGIYPNENGSTVSSFVENHRDLYAPPKSLILGSPQVQALPVSAHFVLGDFVSPPDRGKPCYLALDPRLLDILEAAIARLQSEWGVPENAKPMVVLSAFLSPNELMQFKARGVDLALFSRYQYGDAAAIIWDADGDGRMDDLNRDGATNLADAQLLADRLADVQRRLGIFGGIGAEEKPKLPYMPDTPYVDIDTRGVSSRW